MLLSISQFSLSTSISKLILKDCYELPGVMAQRLARLASKAKVLGSKRACVLNFIFFNNCLVNSLNSVFTITKVCYVDTSFFPLLLIVEG